MGFNSPFKGLIKCARNFSILDFKLHRVLSVVCFLLGNSPASEFYMATFRNAEELPRRNHTNFKTRRKFEIKHISFLLYAFFWVIPRRLNFIWRRFGMPRNYPEEITQISEHGESLKSKIFLVCLTTLPVT